VQTFNLSSEGQITDRFTKAIEQIGASDGTVGVSGKPKPKLEVRLGGIHALERIALDSERDDWVIMEVLTAYVRDRAPYNRQDQDEKKKSQTPGEALDELKGNPPLGEDIQAILTVLGRRRTQYDKGTIDLRYTDLRGARISGAMFSGVDFGGAALSGDLTNVNLNYGRLIGTDLIGAQLKGAHLSHADLKGADLTDATLSDADLT
jgi:Pentapeptide repeats (8 copies)